MKLYLTFGKDMKGRKLAIITDGHFRFGDDETIILDLNDKCKNMKEAKIWFKRMQIEKPWETRQ